MPGLHPHLAGARPAPRRGRRGRRPASAGRTSARARGSRWKTSAESALSAATSVMRRKSWPLVTICVPTSTSTSPACMRASCCSSAPFSRVLSASMRAMRTGSPFGLLHVGQQVAQVLLQPLGAAAHRRDVHVAAHRAGARHAFGVAAVMAAQGAVDLVEHAEGAAVRAFAFPVAGSAGEHGRVAAPVQKDQRLLAARDALLDGVQQLPARTPCASAAGSCPPAAPRAIGPAPRATPSAGAGSAPFRWPASSPARAWPTPAAPWRLRACRGKRPDRAPNSARLPAACSWGRALRRRRSARARASKRTRPCACPARCGRRRSAPPASSSGAADGVMPLFIATTWPAPKRATKRSCSCGVRLISGTITRACASGSRASKRCTACR